MAETQISEWLYAYRKMMAVDAACELRLFTLLEERPRSAEELSELSGARLGPLTSLLEACVALDLLSVEHGAYANRAVARVYLVEGRPYYHGDLFRVFASEAPAWQGLRALLKERPAAAGVGDDRVGAAQFTRAMHALGALGEAQALASSIDLSDRREMVDVGCGSGVYSVALCQRYPHIRATLIDRPEVLEVTAGYVAESGVGPRVSLVPGDFLRDAYGQGRDVVLLSDVLYQESEACLNMLRLAFLALKPGGLLVIRGYFTDLGTGQDPFAALFDLDRLLTSGAREPLLVQRVLGWVADTGFTRGRSFPLTARSTCILADR
jgi:hypothetical protein